MKPGIIFAFIGGALDGAAAALLMAPDSGVNTRRKIREKAEAEYEAAREKFNRIKRECDEKLEEMTE